MKKYTYIILIIIIVIVGFYISVKKNPSDVVTPTAPIVVEVNKAQLCFYQEKKTTSGLFDRQTLKLDIAGDKVTGEYKYLPAEKDSKTGKFEGTAGAVDKQMMARNADVWWDSMAEGMKVREQLKIVFGEGNASALFGEMVDRGDGVYIYKDTNKLTYGENMTDVACNDLDDRSIVEKYIRENIKTITPEKAVLGGSWYVTSIEINPSKKTGLVAYEDGHIAGKISFSYLRDGEKVTLSDTKVIK